MVDELARRRGAAGWARECDASLAECREPDGRPLVLAKPETYMNRSGYAARCLAERRGLDIADLLVVYDEAALPLGRLRLKPSGGPAGHRGMESVLAELRSGEIARLRLGIAPAAPPEDLVGFVLAPFSPGEAAAVEAMIVRAADACEAWLAAGVEAAMNRFNVPSAGEPAASSS